MSDVFAHSWLQKDGRSAGSACQHSFKANHSTADIFWSVALRVEHSLLSGIPVFGICFDYSKCFDLLPHSILFSLAQVEHKRQI